MATKNHHVPAKHHMLDCGIELATEVLPDRRVVALEARSFAGMAYEPADHLGLAHIVVETLDKGTARRDGQALLDAFDSMGIRHDLWSGRECIGFHALCLPEFVDDLIDLFAEMVRTPTFPEDAVNVAVDLARQELLTLEDDPRELAEKILGRQGYGPYLGRHPLGEAETIKHITRSVVTDHWARNIQAGRMQVAVAGACDPGRIADRLEGAFDGFGESAPGGREPFEIEFRPIRSHRYKESEQQQVAVCFPGAPVNSRWYPVQRVVLAILSGGMSSRLFTELREREALVYWVGAWTEYPRCHGMIHLGASTTPQRCDRTYHALLGEVDGLSESLDQAELERAITGIVARTETRGDITRARCGEMADDLFHLGRLQDRDEKLDAVRAVTIDDIQEYLQAYPRDRLSVVTLGPRQLADA